MRLELRSMGRLLLALGALLAGCAATTPAVRETRAAAAQVDPAGADGHDRLDAALRPTRYALDLAIDPRTDRTRGTVAIDLEVSQPTGTVRLHAEAMRSLSARVEAGGRTIRATATLGPNGGLELALAQDLPAGAARLVIDFVGDLDEVPIGLYRVEEGGRWYAFTQFEPLEARKAFPCFDEPGFKTPWEVTLRVPAGMTALTNAPEARRERSGDGSAEVFRFAPSRPLPTYLVAFAVGELEAVEGDAGGVPLRVVTAHGKAHLAAWALAATPPVLEALTEWFGQPYPYQKLDLVAVPNFASGGMENVGLVMFRERLLLLDGDDAPAQQRYWGLVVLAHELAHMWFGNLVTPVWWDDLWLNEAFASWMGTRILDEVHPELAAGADAVTGTAWVMGLDAQTHARAIRQPIVDGGDVYNAFDGITYTKGEAVLDMLNAALGAEVFRDGVRRFMERHAHGSATRGDLMRTLGEASGQPVDAMVGAFIDQPGVPLVSVELVCGRRKAPAELALTQRRYLPLGSEAAAGEPWRIPICVRYGVGRAGAQSHQECFELSGARAEVTLSQPGCPAWLHPNADERGYYRWHVAGDDGTAALATRHLAHLTARERVALPGHLMALLEAGVLELPAALAGLVALAREEHPLVIETVLSALGQLHRVAVAAETRDAFTALARELLTPHLERLGREARPEEPARHTLLRPALLRGLAHLGRARALRDEARAVADRFVADPASVQAEVASVAVSMATWDGDEALWQALVALLPTLEVAPLARYVVVEALGTFGDPALLRRSLDLVLDGTLRSADFRTVMRRAGRLDSVRRAPWEWLQEHYAPLVQRLGEKSAPHLPRLADDLCEPADRDAVAAFFTVEARAPAGTARNLALTLERIDRCARLRAATAEPLRAWLEARTGR